MLHLASYEPVKNKRRILLLTAFVISAAIGLFFRLYPLRNQVSSEAYEKGALIAINRIRQSVRQGVDQKHPQLSPQQRQMLAIKQFDQLVKDETNRVRKAITDAARGIEAQLPGPVQPPYLQASDSYYYYGLTRRILENGAISDRFRGSKYYNAYMLAPEGFWEPLNLHPYLGAWLHQAICFFAPGTPLILSVAYLPLILALLALVFFFRTANISRSSVLAVFTGAVYFLLAIVFLERSLFGWYDNDPYNVLFPLLILSQLFTGLERRSGMRSTVFYGLMTSALIALYGLFWQGWVFIESVIALSGGIILLLNHFVLDRKPDTKGLAVYFLTVLAGAFLGVGLFFGFGEFFVLFKEGWVAVSQFTSQPVSLWPDMYIAVGELRKGDAKTLIGLTGGIVFLAFAVTGLAATGISAFRKKDQARVYQLCVLTVFLAVALFMALGAKRFALLLLTPASLMFVWGVQALFDGLRPLVIKQLKDPKSLELVQGGVCVLLAVGLAIVPIRTAYRKQPSLERQIFNETWEKALAQLKAKTPSDAIVNAWWPPGHFITSFAQRRVSFDGATINKPQAYWIANVFLSTDEKQAAGLLRMLNTSGNQAADYLSGLGFKLSASIDILKAIVGLTRDEARENLLKIMPPQQADEVLSLTHGRPPPTYLLFYNDLVDKNIQLSFIGNWNFKSMEEVQSDPRSKARIPPRKTKAYIEFLWKIAGGRPRFSGALIPVMTEGDETLFEENVLVNFKDMTCRVKSKIYGQGVPRSLMYLDEGKVVEKFLPDPSLSYSVLLSRVNKEPSCLLMERSLARSLIMQMYYFRGAGMKYFKPVIQEGNLTKRTEVFIYEVDWERLEKDLEGGVGE